ncbi:MAG: AraC family transcriptional regulator [Solirubrobacteraceae bacterium]
MSAREITLDRLPVPGGLQVVRFEEGAAPSGPVREPHRHDYHELLWVRSGCGVHRLDGEPLEFEPSSVTVIGRGQVHVFADARDVTGAVIRFGDEILLHGGTDWLLAGRGGRTVHVPDTDADHLDGVIAALAAEAARPPDARSAEAECELLSVILLWIERWYDAERTERRAADDDEVQLQRRFSRVLERDFVRHHDAAHYADELGVPAPALSRALTQVTGRSTKEHVTDRVMLEAQRLLRFTDLTIGEVAHRTGFSDQLYFSRAFKRRTGLAPMAYRDAARGR